MGIHTTGSLIHAHGVDDLVKQHGAVCLEDLPLKTAAEDEDCRHWPALMEAQIICREHMPLGLHLNEQISSAGIISPRQNCESRLLLDSIAGSC